MRPNTDGFSRSATVVNTTIRTCVHYTITGRLEYVARRYGPTAVDHMIQLAAREHEDRQANSGGADAQVRPRQPCLHDQAATREPVRVLGALRRIRLRPEPVDVDQRPWGVSLSFWPSCSNKDAAIFEGERNTPGTGLTKGWDSDWVTYSLQDLGFKPKGHHHHKPRCNGVVARFDIRIGGSARAFRSPIRHEVCPAPKF